jgi:aminoglycoside phosphotransferase family enzyme/predicted kinase
VELNRRLAPDVYLGVADVLGIDGATCDHLVVMRRMPEARRLSTLVTRREDLRDTIRSLARVIARFHAAAHTSPEISAAGSAEANRARWESSFATMAPFYGSVLDEAVATRIEARARRYIEGRAVLFAERIAQHKIRDGHGDLLADDIYCLDDGPRILDCIEFDDQLRHGDVLSDVAFLAMDLERHGATELATSFLEWYREFSDEHYPATLAEHYLAYRAHVRSKVACLRVVQGDEASAAEAAELLALASGHLERTRVVLALVGGLPGTGKSTLSTALADRLGWSVVRSDEVRKDLAGLGHTEHAGAAYEEGIYSPASTERTYEEILGRARRLLERGESVLLDASWRSTAPRAQARALADETVADLCELRCDAPPEVAAARLERRLTDAVDASDATAEVARRMGDDADTWEDATVIPTADSVEASVTAAIAAMGIVDR